MTENRVVSEDTINQIDSVLLTLHNRKVELVDTLFPSSAKAYKDSWIKLDSVGFWSRLDLDNRRRVVEIARGIFEGWYQL